MSTLLFLKTFIIDFIFLLSTSVNEILLLKFSKELALYFFKPIILFEFFDIELSSEL